MGIIICNQNEYIHMQSYIIIRKSIYHYTQVPYIIIRKCRKCRSGLAVPIKMSLAHNTAAAVESLPVRVSCSARQWLHGPRPKSLVPPGQPAWRRHWPTDSARAWLTRTALQLRPPSCQAGLLALARTCTCSVYTYSNIMY
jgi:hypothetical protein